MNRPTFFEQREKVIQAYFKDEIKPYNLIFCFCATLGNKNIKTSWPYCWYSRIDLYKMEDALLITIKTQIIGGEDNKYLRSTPEIDSDDLRKLIFIHSNFDNALFDGMCAALEVLRQIHTEMNDPTVEEQSAKFIKRQLQIKK